MCSDIMCQALALALLGHIAWVHFSFKGMRRDLLKVSKNARQARTELLARRSYKNLSE